MYDAMLKDFAEKVQSALSEDLYRRVAAIEMLGHYTTIPALKSILDGKILWLSNYTETNDLAEVTAGASIVADGLNALGPQIFTNIAYPHDLVVKEFERLRKILERGTYIFSLTDHGRGAGADRIEMWTTYGRGDDSICVVFTKPALLGQSADGRFPAHWTPIQYGDQTALLAELKLVMERLNGVLREFSQLLRLMPPENIAQIIAVCALMPVIQHKNYDFGFEREVRFLHTPALQRFPLPAGAGVANVVSLKGPRQVFSLPLRDYPDLGVNADPANLLDRVIIGPSHMMDQRVAEVRALLDTHGLQHVRAEKSKTSFRPR